MKSPREEGETAAGSFTGVGVVGTSLVLLLVLLPSAALLLLLLLEAAPVAAPNAGGAATEPSQRTAGW